MTILYIILNEHMQAGKQYMPAKSAVQLPFPTTKLISDAAHLCGTARCATLVLRDF